MSTPPEIIGTQARSYKRLSYQLRFRGQEHEIEIGYVCSECSGVVHDMDDHDRFHERLLRTILAANHGELLGKEVTP